MQKRKLEFRWVKWLALLLLVVATILAVVLVKNNIFDNRRNEDIKNNQEVVAQNDDKKETDGLNENVVVSEEKKTPQYEGDSPNNSEVLTGLITYMNVENDKLTIRVGIDQFLQSGSCDLKLYKDNKTFYAQSSKIVESVTTSVCDGFEIQKNELPEGELRIEIMLNSDGKSGKIEGKVSI